MKKAQNKGYREQKRSSSRLSIMVFATALIVAAILANADLRGKVMVSYLSSPEEVIQYRWNENTALLRKALLKDVDDFTSNLSRTIASSGRIENFADDYYGFFTGISLMGSSMADLFSSGNPRTEAKMEKMVKEHLLFDLDIQLNELGENLEATAGLYEDRWLRAVRKDLAGQLSQAEQDHLIRKFRFQTISQTPSMVSAGGQLLAWNLPEVIVAGVMGGSFASGLSKGVIAGPGSRLIAGAVSKGVSSTLTKVMSGIIVGIVIDMIIQKIVRMSTEDGLKVSVGNAMDSFIEELRLDLTRSIDRTLKGVQR
ncbi:hypothetical protein [Dethiosulfovibrio salsuginis]|uniref:Uncharacterized protein n=1 Tax=Dethiosulfovibrio salsuginis TaxID=561720 RepID=A0A1X7K7H7_9BACT|nr:hypothetical protein [Dethiosulfovibrio salsuginis]SMG36959.1 hypothetical protein SAMN06275492_12240 [Dethiosulfovibrio salsuginis]